jgi:hypothetical protein
MEVPVRLKSNLGPPQWRPRGSSAINKPYLIVFNANRNTQNNKQLFEKLPL